MASRPTPDVCEHGNAESQTLIRQLAEALGHDLPALPETPETTWNRLLDEVEGLRRDLHNQSFVLDAWKGHHAALHSTCDAYGPGLAHRVVRADADTPMHNFRCLGCGEKLGHYHLEGCER